MRLTIIAALGVLLTACNRNDDAVGDAMPATEAAANDAATAAQIANEPVEESAPTTVAAASDVSPCLIQDGEELRITPVKAVGTEPFWAARVEGRCVTYSTPEDQQGTRVWTRFNPGPDGGLWVGSLNGQPFKLVTRLRQGCSDGMSDTRYPMDAVLTVRGEERRGCAAPE